MNVLLHPDLAKFIDEQIKAGRFKRADDVINGALAMLQAQEEALTRQQFAALRAQIAIGIEQSDRGEVEDWDVDELRAEGQRLLNEKNQKKVKPAPKKKAV